jgi:two-component system, NarL family, response regulator NreC
VSPHTDPGEFPSRSAKIRCLLAHDHVLLRQALRRLLEDEPDIDVVSEASSAAECLRQVYEFRPDVAVVDAHTLGLRAAEAKLCLARESPGTRFVFLSTERDASVGYLPVNGGCDVRATSAEELVDLVRNLVASRCEPHTSFVHTSQNADGPRSPEVRPLTAREREVLKLLAEGKTVRTAATMLGVSSKTVDSHKFNLMRKLGIHNKAELVMWAVQKKVVRIPVNL